MKGTGKAILIVIAIVATAGLVLACDAPRIAFTVYEHDFGEVAPRTSLNHVFVFRNTGKATLTITRVSPG